MLRRERRVWRAADIVLYPSQAEVDHVVALQPGVVARAVQPYSFADFAPPRRLVRRQVLLFVAGFAHPPNELAALWLARDIMLMVNRQAPLAHLVIVGSNPTPRVRALADLGVTIAADVSDTELREWYAMARVAIVPLRHGAGVKRKVVEALREGVPLVTTPVGAQGLPGLSAVASVCGTVETIATAAVALLCDDLLWADRSAAGIAYARAHFSEATLRTSLCRAMGVPDATPGLPLPLLGEVGARSVPGEGVARATVPTRVTALTRVAGAPRPLPKAGEVKSGERALSPEAAHHG
jgi:glycosyltransferase involved in cell wall biosynthesis